MAKKIKQSQTVMHITAFDEIKPEQASEGSMNLTRLDNPGEDGIMFSYNDATNRLFISLSELYFTRMTAEQISDPKPPYARNVLGWKKEFISTSSIVIGTGGNNLLIPFFFPGFDGVDMAVGYCWDLVWKEEDKGVIYRNLKHYSEVSAHIMTDINDVWELNIESNYNIVIPIGAKLIIW